MRTRIFHLALLISACVLTLIALAAFETPKAAAQTEAPAPGGLDIVDSAGKSRGSCPLKHTSVRGEISGFLSRVTVTQDFENPLDEKIEAVYTFPLPQAAAVDDMTLIVGDRTVRGKILRREEAQAVYNAARSAGQVAGLLDQERPNVFTQSVANIMPGARVKVTISYVETLKYEDGTYEFTFPMVVGERYVPGAATGARQGGGGVPDTDRVPDASRITPPRAPAGKRAGHDISVEVALDAGVPVDSLSSTSHEIEVDRASASSARVRLKNLSAIPNKDFTLRYDVAGRRMTDAVLTHRDDRGGFFTMILQPPERVTVRDVTPKELVFVLDTSGSMSGFPIEKAKEAMNHALDGLNPQDTFNLITFAGDTNILFPEPVRATRGNLAKARRFLNATEGSGGTEMMEAIRVALEPSDSRAHVRVVCFMTDGEVGNDMEIISEIQKHPNARVFSFGIGSSVNRFLLDKMAEAGRGEVEYVSLSDDGSAAALRFHERVRNPLLTDISIDWAGLPVADIYPRRIPDLFSAKPVVITGRYTGAARGVIRLRGRMSGNHFERESAVVLPDAQPAHDVLSTLWARTRVDDLMGEDYLGVQQGNERQDVREAITSLGLEFRLMTQFTSFVAVEEMTITDGNQPRRIDVPVELPEGVGQKFEIEGTSGTENAVVVSAAAATNIQSAQLNLITSSGGVQETVEVTADAPVLNSSMRSTPTRRMKRASNKRGSKSGAKSVGGGGAGGGMGAGRGSYAGGGTVAATVLPTQSRMATLTAEVARVEPVMSPEAQKQFALQTKMHASIFAVVWRLKNKEARPSAGESEFVRDGKAEIRVWLTEKSEATLERLKQLGLEILLDPKAGKLVIGRIPVEKLEALAEIESVRFVAPQASGEK